MRRELVVRLDRGSPGRPTLSGLSFTASRFEREIHDMFAIVPVGHPFLRPLVRHQHWPEGCNPLRRDAGADAADASRPLRPIPFIEVRGLGRLRDPGRPRARWAHRAWATSASRSWARRSSR